MKKAVILLFIIIIMGCSNSQKKDNKKIEKGDKLITESKLGYEIIPRQKGEYNIIFKTAKNDIEGVELVLENRNKSFEMRYIGSDSNSSDLYVYSLKIEDLSFGYYFRITDGKEFYYGENFSKKRKKVIVLEANYSNYEFKLYPEWLMDRVWYQIL